MTTIDGRRQVTVSEWIAALESGEYRKARSMLRNPNTGGLCCIGVLHKLCGTPDSELDGSKTFLPEKLPEWTADWHVHPSGAKQYGTHRLNKLAVINDKTAGYPIEKIKELYGTGDA